MPRDDYVLTCADGLQWPALAPFVRSLRAHAPNARLVVLTAHLDDATKGMLRSHGAELHPFDGVFPEVAGRTVFVRTLLWAGARLVHRVTRYPEWRRRWLQRLGGVLLPRNQARFFAFSALLDDVFKPGDRALMCDARDVVFQADPFPLLPDTGLILTQEEVHVRIADNPFNAHWYRATFGSAALARVADRPVNCAGVIGGERAAVGKLLDALQVEAARRLLLEVGADQAIVNHLYFENKITATVFPNRRSLAWHLYGVPPAEIVVTANQEIRDATGYLYPVVHMYDRLPQTTEAVMKKWGV